MEAVISCRYGSHLRPHPALHLLLCQACLASFYRPESPAVQWGAPSHSRSPHPWPVSFLECEMCVCACVCSRGPLCTHITHQQKEHAASIQRVCPQAPALPVRPHCWRRWWKESGIQEGGWSPEESEKDRSLEAHLYPTSRALSTWYGSLDLLVGFQFAVKL